jgi:hypothetical protein
MPSADQVKAVISSLTEGDEAHFYSVAMQISAHEARMGHGKLAEEIRHGDYPVRKSSGN